ncbi:MAG: 2-isopropylmalate synthase [Gammaproteobacteria bacterium]|nr:2-isopropylmalate synthase [Gammaproteobacteria bacterium]
MDETLRDGLQSPSVTDPTIEQKIELIHLMEDLGIRMADVGLPGAGRRAQEDVRALVEEIRDSGMKLKPMCAARTMVRDVEPVADIAQRTGVPMEVYTFIGSSPIRLYVESWSLDTLLRRIDETVTFAMREGLEVCLVTEDTTRSRPDVLDPLFRAAVRLGVRRLCLCDTVGHVTPDGMKNLFDWTHSLIRGLGEPVELDWHGHNDRGLGVTNAILAIEYGATRAHGTGLGVGERVGNASIDQMLLNLKLLGEWDHDLSKLGRYCQAVSRYCRVDIHPSYPMAGRDAFRTGTGVHAAAIIKALKRGDRNLADRVYSGVPANWFGRDQEIEIGHMSGLSNVSYWLASRRIPVDDELCSAILARAKSSNRVLTDDEVMDIVREHRGDPVEEAIAEG